MTESGSESECECECDEPIQSQTDIFTIMAQLQDVMKDGERDLCVCERNSVCNCKGECWCDEDDFYTVKSFSIDMGSNCNALFDIELNSSEKKISKNKNIRFFTLHKKTDEEQSVMEIKKTFKKKNKRKVVDQINMEFQFKNPKVLIELYDDIKVGEGTLSFILQYMNYQFI